MSNRVHLVISDIRKAVFSIVKDICLTLLCCLGMVISTKIKVPFFPVPFTMQTFAVVMISLFARRRIAIQSLLFFVMWWNPSPLTFGYILSFFIVPFILYSGVAKHSNFSLLCRFFLSHFLILAIGALVLSCFIGIKMAWISGFLMFIPAEIFKWFLELSVVSAYKNLER